MIVSNAIHLQMRQHTDNAHFACYVTYIVIKTCSYQHDMFSCQSQALLAWEIFKLCALLDQYKEKTTPRLILKHLKIIFRYEIKKIYMLVGVWGGEVVKALRYYSDGPGFDFRSCQRVCYMRGISVHWLLSSRCGCVQ